MVTEAITQLIRIGTDKLQVQSDKRNLQISNFICLVMAGALMVIVIFRLLVGGLELWFYLPLFIEAIFFLGLLSVTRVGFPFISRILLCWTPPIFLIIDFKILIEHLPVPETSHFLGFRIFQVAFSIFPFLMFNVSERGKFFAALLVPVVIVIAYDKILELAGVGYYDLGLKDTSYLYNNFRTTIALLIIGSAFVFLKRLLEKQELRNEKLIAQLEQQNVIIQKNSERALKKAYDRLSYHITNTPLAVIERDKDFRVTFWNKRAEELLGWSEEEARGLKPQDFIVYPEDAPAAVKIMNEALAEKRDSNFMEIRAVTKDGRVLNCLWYYSFLRDEHGELDTVLSFISDITEQRKANYYLNERIKELRTLYNVSQLLTTSDKAMEEVFAVLPNILPGGWQYPNECATRLRVFGSDYQTSNYKMTPFSQARDIIIENKPVGHLEVVYLEEKPIENEGPFLTEERDLLIAIVQMLQVYIERKLEEEALMKTQASLSATINNTEIVIWSVDHNFLLTSFNEAFRTFVKETLGTDVDDIQDRPFCAFSNADQWHELYQRVFTGEVFTFEETVGAVDFRYSLSPIIDNAKIIGVSIFADNITVQNQRNRELNEANKKISDLKMMALRSVMNPHFIFNVLSSIQYFITRNDELNAINYLTSFSKLMRTVLTRSVADLVSVKEELDLLHDYIYLEKLRFENKFDVTIECQGSINPDEISMPSLLIQPYVENAILHGLYNKEGEGHLLISVSAEDGFLQFLIEDDGIGRKAAQAYRDKSKTKRESMGTKLTEERLLIFNGDSIPPVVYEDLYNGNEPAGTRATIRVKINPQ
ncbi:MAG TPA: PAS domain S-box protein [Chryseosolibacter sp.]